MTRAFAVVLTVLLSVAAVHAAADWPQWQGADRTRMSRATGLLKEWPSGGPQLIWTANDLGAVLTTLAVATHNRVLFAGYTGDPEVSQLIRARGLNGCERRSF